MRTIVKNKNGILMPETLKIIMAVIGISILAYLVFSFYGVFVKSSQLKQAEASLNLIKEKINFIEKDGENINVLLTSPKDWYLLVLEKEEVPYLCICEDIVFEDEKQINVCEKKGICAELNQNVLISNFEEKTQGAMRVKRKALKISVEDFVIEKKEEFIYLTKGIEEAEVSNIFREFLSNEVDTSKIDLNSLHGIKNFSQVSNVEDLIRIFCIDSRNWYTGDLEIQFNNFFNRYEFLEQDFVSLGFRKQSVERPTWKSRAYPYEVEYHYPKESSSKYNFNEYKFILLEDGGYCGLYFTSTKSDFNEK